MARTRLAVPNYKLTQRGSYFHVQWYEDGKARRVPTGTTDSREAERFLAQFVAGQGTPEPPSAPSVSQILTGYLADRKAKPVRAYDTLEVAAKALRRHLADLQPDHLTRERVRFYCSARRAEGHMVGPADARYKKVTSDGTLIRELTMLRAALAWAKRERWITGDLPYIEVPSQPPARDRWLTRDEADRLLEKALAPHMKVFIGLALHTAARSGAILELTWNRVHLDSGVIDLGEGHGRKRRGAVPINDRLRPILEQARAMATCPYVVEHGGQKVASIKTGFNAAARRAGIKGVSPHVLRHTAVSWMVQRGVPLAMVARYASMTEAMVEKRYGHHAPDYLKQAAMALAG
jgi:integrase